MVDEPEADRDMLDTVMAMTDSLLSDPDTTTTQALELASAFLSVSADILSRILGVDTAKTMLRSAADAFDHIPTEH